MITVAVLSYNGKHYLDDCLNSLARQSYRDMEVLLVDNGSTDGTPEYVKGCFPWVRLEVLSHNCGVTGGLNACVRFARGEYVALLNNDVEVDKNWLGYLYAMISADKTIAACDSKILYFDKRDIIWSCGADYSIAGSVTPRGWMQHEGAIQRPTDVFAAVGCAAIYRRKLFDEIGGFDEDFFLGYEDIDWSFRARLHGYRIVNVPVAIVYHKASATIGNNSFSYVYNGQRNVSAVFIKNMPMPILLRYLPLHLIYIGGSMLYFLKIGCGRAFFRAKWDLLKQLPVLWRKRRQVQQQRRVSSAEIDSLLDRHWFKSKLDKVEGSG